MSIDLSIFDKVVTWGQPWHGVMQQDGTFTSDLGAQFVGKRPSQYDANSDGIDFSRQHTLVMFKNLPDFIDVLSETQAGQQYKKYAILVGGTRQYSPASKLIRFGERSFLYCTTTNLTTWVIFGKFLSSDLVFFAYRTDALISSSVEIGRWPSFANLTNDQYLRSAPDGHQATLGMLEINISGGSDSAAPVCDLQMLSRDARAVSDDGSTRSREYFYAFRYMPDGSRKEVWMGETICYNGDKNGEQSAWFYVGENRYEIGRVVKIDALTWDIVDFSGASRRLYGTLGISIQLVISLPCGVVARMSSWVNSYYSYSVSVLIVGIQGKTKSAVNLPDDASVEIFTQKLVEHPVTGDFIDGYWVW